MISIQEALAEGDKIVDLAVRPHERVSLMRLLICVAHAALNGPEDRTGWETVPGKLPQAAKTYLERWKDSFELFHPKHPFLQTAGIKSEKKTPISKLSFHLATGNNTTLHDREGLHNELRKMSPERIALSLVSFQCFSPGGLSSVVTWEGEESNRSAKDAPCCTASMLHAQLRGETLSRTIHLNMPTYVNIRRHYKSANIGRPVWEMPPSSHGDAAGVENATQTYLGRLAPISRLIKIMEDGGAMLLGEGLHYPPFTSGFPAEPTATVVMREKNKKQEPSLLSYRPEKSVWRELGAMTVLRNADGAGGALSLDNLKKDESCDIVVSCFARDQATIVDTAESIHHIPLKMSDQTGIDAYNTEIRIAEGIAGRLGWAVETYRQAVDGAWQGRTKMDKEARTKLQSMAKMNYWTKIEQSLRLLMAHVEAIGSEDEQRARGEWRRQLIKTAYVSYRMACPSGTPRQMKAHVLGLDIFNAKLKTGAGEKEAEEDAAREQEKPENEGGSQNMPNAKVQRHSNRGKDAKAKEEGE